MGLGMNAAARILLAIIGAALAMILAVSVANANDDLILQGKMVLNLPNRPYSIYLVPQAEAYCDQTDTLADTFGCAKFAYDMPGRCIIYLEPNHLAHLYHELQHCSGITHRLEGD